MSVRNLAGYCTARAQHLAALDLAVVSPAELGTLVAWCVPGVLRMAYTIETDDVTSKSGACRWGLGWLGPRWHPIIEDALAIRHSGSPVRRAPAERRLEAVALMGEVIDRATGGS